jgi:hypothetical protein
MVLPLENSSSLSRLSHLNLQDEMFVGVDPALKELLLADGHVDLLAYFRKDCWSRAVRSITETFSYQLLQATFGWRELPIPVDEPNYLLDTICVEPSVYAFTELRRLHSALKRDIENYSGLDIRVMNIEMPPVDGILESPWANSTLSKPALNRVDREPAINAIEPAVNDDVIDPESAVIVNSLLEPDPVVNSVEPAVNDDVMDAEPAFVGLAASVDDFIDSEPVVNNVNSVEPAINVKSIESTVHVDAIEVQPAARANLLLDSEPVVNANSLVDSGCSVRSLSLPHSFTLDHSLQVIVFDEFCRRQDESPTPSSQNDPKNPHSTSLVLRTELETGNVYISQEVRLINETYRISSQY